LVVVKLFSWIDSGTLRCRMGAALDTLTAVMLIVVTGVSAMVHVYSIGYMATIPASRASWRLSQPVHLLHADAGDGGQLRAAVLRLGRRRALRPTC
jgi:formate hydrogenlyase subunit 3/multisubunit Na+/H+ antiporter MnhD subunit